MSYGAYWMYYDCPKCGRQFKYTLDAMSSSANQSVYGICDVCKAEGILVGEGCNPPIQEENYKDVD